MTLIQFTDPDGQVHKCDSKCYDAKGPICNCPCGGKNHGVGFAQALANVPSIIEGATKEWEKEHGEIAEVWTTRLAPAKISTKKG